MIRTAVHKKPNPEEFEISKNGIVHFPTKERFTSHPGKPADGHWQDGHTLAAEYDQDEVRQWGAICGPSTSLIKSVVAEFVLRKLPNPARRVYSK